MAVKTRNIYRGYSAADLYNRASATADKTQQASSVDFTNITTMKIRNVLGESLNTIRGLSRSDNVNVWSGFGPTVRSVSSQALVNSKPSDGEEANDFAGYNHGARIPGWISSAPSADIWVNSGGNAVFSVDVYVGEVLWHTVANGIVGIVLAIYDGSTLVAWGARNFNDSSVKDDVTGLQATITGVSLQKTYTGKVWLVDSTADFDESQIVCRLPNTSNFSQTVKIKAASSCYYSATGTGQPPAPWTNNNGPLGINWTTGYVTIGYDLQTNNSWSNVRVKATLYNWLDEVIGTADIFNAAYNALDSLDGTAYVGMANIPAYGYRVVVEFLYTT